MALLAGRRALVTGGTRGIGAAIVDRFVREGASVLTTGVSPNAVVAGAEYRGVDFTDRAAAERFAGEIREREFDILVNNAGINRIAPFAEVDLADFDRIQEVNIRVPMLLCQAVLPGMRRRGWGRVVNISSIWGVVSKEQRSAYSASKFALDGLTAALAAEAAADGVLANCVAPGFVDTDLTRETLGAKGIAELSARVPMKRLGRPDEIAALVLWLASQENTYMSGQNLVIDGGFTRV